MALDYTLIVSRTEELHRIGSAMHHRYIGQGVDVLTRSANLDITEDVLIRIPLPRKISAGRQKT